MRVLKLFPLFLFLLLYSCKETPVTKTRSPRDLFPGLFEDVQSAGVFPDGKTFPDYVPKRDPENILEDYHANKTKPGFNLKNFVAENFSVPETAGKAYRSNRQEGLEIHITSLWDILKRNPDKHIQHSSLIGLPYPYIVPGGRFREIYYWDSFFTMLGLQESGRTDLTENMVNNFAWLVRTYGFIPNGNRTYYLTRSQPPFFSLMLELLMESKSPAADSVLKANRDVLEKEYSFWMKGSKIKQGAEGHVVVLPDGTILNRYFDRGDWPREESYNEDLTTAAASTGSRPEIYRQLRSGAESGWDFSSRWLADGKSLTSIHTTDIVPVDLNALLYHLELMLVRAYEKSGEKTAAEHMKEQAERRRTALNRFCWDRKTGYFRDYDWKQLKQTGQLSLAGVYPLYFKMAVKGQADAIARVLRKDFLKPGGLVTTRVNSGQQWDAPNGWAPLQWIAIQGLRNYGQDELADEISTRWIALNSSVFNKTGKLMEKYNVADTSLIAGGGEYPNQDGFGWTNGVLLRLIRDKKR